VKPPAHFKRPQGRAAAPRRERSTGDWGYPQQAIFAILTGREIEQKARVCTTLPCLPDVFFSIPYG